MVVKCIDGEDLLPLYGRQSEDSRNVIVPVLELSLIEKDFYITIVYDSLLDNGGVYHVIQLLRHHTGDAVELAYRLVQILDVLCHCRRGNRFPCLFDDECLTTFLDTHLLEEHIHDDEHHDREQHRVVLDFVYLKDDKSLIKK